MTGTGPLDVPMPILAGLKPGLMDQTYQACCELRLRLHLSPSVKTAQVVSPFSGSDQSKGLTPISDPIAAPEATVMTALGVTDEISVFGGMTDFPIDAAIFKAYLSQIDD